MVRPKQKRGREPLPPPLPPAERTVGQLVAETLRIYGSRFWRSVALGVGPAATGLGLALIGGWWRLAFVLTAGALLMSASFAAATLVVGERPVEGRRLLDAIGVGWLVFLPVPFLASVFVLPAVLWLAFVGLAVPAVLLEGLDLRGGLRRAVVLARADYVHAAGSLATLVITGFLTSTVLFFVLRGQGEAARSAAAFLSLVVISPVLFLGGALLYFDQAARAVSSRPTPRRRRNAEVPDADDADAARRTDAQVEPRPAP